MTFLKKWAYHLHRIPGYVIGVVVFVICATGGILGLEDEIRHLLEPEKYVVSQPHESSPLPLDSWIAEIEERENEPDRGIFVKVSRIQSYADPERNCRLLMTAHQGEDTWNYILYADPYTGRICGYYETDGKMESFFAEVKRIHRFLGLPVHIGRPIVGISTLIFVGVLFTGLIRWIPSNGRRVANWKRGFTLSFRLKKVLLV